MMTNHYMYKDNYYVLKIPILAFKIESLRQTEALYNTGMWCVFRLENELLMPVGIYQQLVEPVPYKQQFMEYIVVQGKAAALAKAAEMNNREIPRGHSWLDWLIDKLFSFFLRFRLY